MRSDGRDPLLKHLPHLEFDTWLRKEEAVDNEFVDEGNIPTPPSRLSNFLKHPYSDIDLNSQFEENSLENSCSKSSAPPSLIFIACNLPFSTVTANRINPRPPETPQPSSFCYRLSFSSETAVFVNARLNWKETPEAHIFKADLPGLKKEEMKVEVEAGIIANTMKKSSYYCRRKMIDNGRTEQITAEVEHKSHRYTGIGEDKICCCIDMSHRRTKSELPVTADCIATRIRNTSYYRISDSD
ncbi:hypothetical protein NE237_012903 [Protea cynaroides]|uniref:SHSP domain-containing protein n=1 Tax=Protea cynaroides TaxID=273540 RepID=A0A9Q0JZA2_9MAGN|nr:hypothetical protein NE237_012903 [Protea cynaroides]